MEIARVDPSIFNILLVSTTDLAMGSIYIGGSEEQKAEMATADGPL